MSTQQQNFVKDLERILSHFVPIMVLVLAKLAKVKSKLSFETVACSTPFHPAHFLILFTLLTFTVMLDANVKVAGQVNTANIKRLVRQVSP